MITGAQIRCARAGLRWTAAELAVHAGVGVQTVKRLETHEGVPHSRSSSLAAIQSALEAAGIEFIGTPTDRPGIRLPTKPPL